MNGDGPTTPSSSDRSELGVETRQMRASLEQRMFGESEALTIGRYRVEDRIGKGAMGVVFRAHDPSLSRTIALKLLSSARAGDDRDAFVARLVREAKVLAKVNHPNVVTVHDVGVDNDQVFIAMEFVEGISLAQWMREHAGRDRLREGLALFEQAGRGLAAAHAVGLVHRDFKPENVLVGADGRVRVLDFGLAVGVVESVSSKSTLESGELITRTGQAVGTPAYMAPEQFDGIADAATDQYSFCVSLFELAYGRRPHTADTLPELALKVVSEDIAVPDAAGVSRALRKLLQRGLARAPADRHPTMDALLRELHRIRTGTRRSISVALVGVGGLAGAGLVWSADDRGPDCAATAEAAAAVWSETTAGDVRAAFADTELPFADAAASRLVAAVDEHVARWSNARVETCEATNVSAEVHDLRVACLERSLRELAARVDVWREANATVVENAESIAAGLPGIEACERSDRLLAETPLPDDEGERALAAEVDEVAARTGALSEAARYDEAFALLDPLRKRATASTHPPTIAKWYEVTSALALATGDTATFGTDARLGFQAALRSGHDACAARLAARLANRAALETDDAVARDWAHTALALAERSGAGARVQSRALSQLGMVAARNGELEQAERDFERAIALAEEAGDEVTRLEAIADMSTVYANKGELSKGSEALERVLAGQRALYGDEHPKVAHELLNISTFKMLAGKYDEAEAPLRRAIEIWERTYGKDYFKLTQALRNVSMLAARRGDAQGELEAVRRMTAITEKHDGEQSPATVKARSHLAVTLMKNGQLEEAMQAADRNVAAARRTYDATSEELAWVLGGSAIVFASGRCERALALADETTKILEAAPPSVSVQRSRTYGTVVYAMQNCGELAESVAPAQRQIDMLTGAPESNPAEIASTRMNLARALDAAGRREDAMEEARAGVAAMREHGGVNPDDLAKGEAWIAARE